MGPEIRRFKGGGLGSPLAADSNSLTNFHNPASSDLPGNPHQVDGSRHGAGRWSSPPGHHSCRQASKELDIQVSGMSPWEGDSESP